MPDKTISAWLVVDWKQETTRTRQTKPGASDLGTNELLAEINVDVTVPEVDVPTLALEIEVPEPQVYAATLEALDDEDLPDWSDVAAEVVDDHEAAIRDLSTTDPRAKTDLVDQLTARVLLEVNTRPDPSNVRQYVERLVANARVDEPPQANTDA